MLTRLRATIVGLFQRDRFEHDMTEEMRFHMRAYADDLQRAGVSPQEAERRARMEFGGVESLREDCREAYGFQWFDELRQDLRYSVRQILRAPGFSAAVIVSIALGIGANTAIFSLMDAALFRALPIADPTSLYYLAHRSATDSSTSSNYPLFDRYKSADMFSGVTAYSTETFTVSTADGRERVTGQFVSGNYHDVLGVPIVVGRGFSNEPDRPSGQTPIAVISYDYWERRLARRSDVVGRTLAIGGRTVTIVGVTARGFHGLESGYRTDITLPISIKVLSEPGFLGDREGWTSLSIIGRLAPGVTEGRALAAVDALFRRFWWEPENAWARDPRAPAEFGLLVPAGKGSGWLRQRYATPLRTLMGMVGIVLLIACANVANLLLARASARSKEVAVRLSIGAGRARLVRQFLTESLVLAGVGGALGLAVAVASAGAILSLFDTGQSPVRFDVALNGRVLGFTVLVAVLTGVGFGLVPAFSATRVDLTRALKEGGNVGRRGRLAVGKTLVIAQIALCVLVIAASGLLVRSLRNLRTFDAGFERDNVLLFNLATGGDGFTPERRAALYKELEGRLRRLPGVAAVSLSSRSPIDFSAETRRIVVPGFQAPGRHGVSAYVVTPDFFRVFGIRLLRGRGFEEPYPPGAPNVALVNEAMARFYFGSSDPIGRTLRFGSEQELSTIVGVVEDSRHEQLREAAPATVYTPFWQPTTGLDGRPDVRDRVTVEIRTTSGLDALEASVRHEVRSLSKDATVWYIRTMQQQLDAALIRERLLAKLSSGFGVLALLLAFVGLYGVMSYRVARRVREIGIRVALGATRGMVSRRVLRETLGVAVVGLGIGLAAAFATMKVVSAFLFQLSPRDPGMFAIVAVLLLATALVAGYLPARRAAGVDPMQALRSE